MSHSSTCLNCNAPLTDKYCAQCGQSANTHRLSIKHFIEHELVHGLFHLDKGIVYTLRKLMTKPGYTVRDYIAGKRTGHFNLITLILLEITVILVYKQSHTSHTGNLEGIHIADGTYQFQEMIRHNTKWVFLAFVPIVSIAGLITFKKSKYNYTEHLVMNAFVLAGILFIAICLMLLVLLLQNWFNFSNLTTLPVYLLYLLWVYYQTFRNHYSIGGWVWRMLLHLILTSVSVLLTAAAIVMVYDALTNGSMGVH